MIYTFSIAIEGPDDNEGIIAVRDLLKILAELKEVVAKRGYYLHDSNVEEEED